MTNLPRGAGLYLLLLFVRHQTGVIMGLQDKSYFCIKAEEFAQRELLQINQEQILHLASAQDEDYSHSRNFNLWIYLLSKGFSDFEREGPVYLYDAIHAYLTFADKESANLLAYAVDHLFSPGIITLELPEGQVELASTQWVSEGYLLLNSFLLALYKHTNEHVYAQTLLNHTVEGKLSFGKLVLLKKLAPLTFLSFLQKALKARINMTNARWSHLQSLLQSENPIAVKKLAAWCGERETVYLAKARDIMLRSLGVEG